MPVGESQLIETVLNTKSLKYHSQKIPVTAFNRDRDDFVFIPFDWRFLHANAFAGLQSAAWYGPRHQGAWYH